MPSRFICPHCHHSIDPLALETADCADVRYRICPECDEPLVLSTRHQDTSELLPTVLPPAVATPAPAPSAESLVQ